MKKLLATTALVAMTSTAAFAQDVSGTTTQFATVTNLNAANINSVNRDVALGGRIDDLSNTVATGLGGQQSQINGISAGVTSLEEGEALLNARVTALENADMPSSGSSVSQEDIDNTIGEFNTNRDHPLYDGEGGTGSSTTNYDTVGEAVQDALYYNGYNEVNINDNSRRIDELENADTITTEEAAALIGSATSGVAIESEVNAKNTQQDGRLTQVESDISATNINLAAEGRTRHQQDVLLGDRITTLEDADTVDQEARDEIIANRGAIVTLNDQYRSTQTVIADRLDDNEAAIDNLDAKTSHVDYSSDTSVILETEEYFEIFSDRVEINGGELVIGADASIIVGEDPVTGQSVTSAITTEQDLNAAVDTLNEQRISDLLWAGEVDRQQYIEIHELQDDHEAQQTQLNNLNSDLYNTNTLIYSVEDQANDLDSRLATLETTDNTGERGAQGIQGERGAKGDRGDRGIQGERGLTGAKGDQGETGAQGIQGTQGIQGETGATGAQGIQGEQGIQGIAGQDGADGQDGRDGIDGTNGTDGIDGAKGDKGDKGDRGEAGRDGVDGKDGKDADMSLVTENTDAIMANSAALDNVEAAQEVLAEADKALSEAIASGDATAIAATATAKAEVMDLLNTAKAQAAEARKVLDNRLSHASTRIDANRSAIASNKVAISNNSAAIKQNTKAIAGVAAQVSGLSALGGGEGMYAGTASTNGESAIAIGVQQSISETVTWNLGVSSDFRGESVTVSAGIGWKF